MLISYWCIFIALLLPWIYAVIGKILGGFKKNHNIDPRQFEVNLKGKAKNAILHNKILLRFFLHLQ